MIPVDRSSYGPSAFKANKTAQANALRFCYEIRNFLFLEESGQTTPKASKSLAKYLDRVHQIVAGEQALGKGENARLEVADVLAEDNTAAFIVSGLPKLDFEISKQVLSVLSSLLTISPRLQDNFAATMSVLLPSLLQAYTHAKLYVICGPFFRELLQYPPLCERILTVETLQNLAVFTRDQLFEVSADAVESVKTLLFSEFQFVNRFLTGNFHVIVAFLHGFRDTENYFLKRQSLVLLYRLLQRPGNELFRYLYASEPEHLKYIMTAMKSESSRQVKVETFLIFTALAEFLMEQPAHIQEASASFKIVKKNKEKLLKFLSDFGLDQDDEKFHATKQRLIEKLQLIS